MAKTILPRNSLRLPVNMLLAVLLLCSLLSGNHSFLTTSTPTRLATSTHSAELNLFRGLNRVLEQKSNTVNGEANGITVNGKRVNGYANRNSQKVPFIIERLGSRPRDDVFKGIAEMCIRCVELCWCLLTC